MTTTWSVVNLLSDEQLLAEVKTLATRERRTTAGLVAALSEMDARRLYLGQGCSSLFTYCTQVLHLSEHAAYGRIEAARAARRFPIVLDRLADGSITLTAVCLLAPHLTIENHREVLERARAKSKREVELIVAGLRPQPSVQTTVRKLPIPHAAEPRRLDLDAGDANAPPTTCAGLRAAVVAPLTPETYRIQFTMSREMHDRLRRAQALLRHTIPSGELATIFDRALALLLTDLEKSRCAATTRPGRARSAVHGSRHVPADVRREVWKRDDGRCAFVGANGRCTERGFLEYHHIVPYAEGGPTTTHNLELRCRAHNQYEADLFFGPMMVREAHALWLRTTRSGPS
jgi:hypothetical protein